MSAAQMAAILSRGRWVNDEEWKVERLSLSWVIFDWMIYDICSKMNYAFNSIYMHTYYSYFYIDDIHP